MLVGLGCVCLAWSERKRDKDNMNVSMNSAMDLGKLRDDATRAQAAVVTVVDREEQLLKSLEDLASLEGNDLYEAAAELYLEAEGLTEIHRILQEQIGKVKKRVEKIAAKVIQGIQDEFDENELTSVETDKFELAVKFNPPSVQIDDAKKVPKEFRHEPKPIPSWKEWAPDKNAIKKALLNKEKRSIAGVSLVRGKKLVINRK